MKLLIYTRGGNEERQIAKCEEYAKEHGYTIIGKVNSDHDLSGHLASGNIDAVIVSEPSRVSRKRTQYIFAEKMLNMYGVKLLVAEKGNIK